MAGAWQIKLIRKVLFMIDAPSKCQSIAVLKYYDLFRFPLVFMAIAWVLLGQFMIIFLINERHGLQAVVDFISLVIPSVESLKIAHVFNNDTARDHHAMMWMLSPILIGISLFFPVVQKEKQCFIRKPSQAINLSLALFGLAVVSACFDFYTGIFSFGLGLNAHGFAILSSLESFLIVIACRYAKLAIN